MRRTPKPLEVVCFSTTVSAEAGRRRYLDAWNFLRALKGEPVEGRSPIPVGGRARLLDNSNRNDSLDWFGEMVARHLRQSALRPPLLLVPVPASTTTLESSAGSWTSLLAISIASSCTGDVRVLDVLRWRRAWDDEAPRLDAEALYRNLTVTKSPEWSAPVILVDYLFRSPAPLAACTRVLTEAGANVTLALCAGRRAERAEVEPFAVVKGRLRFVPR